MPLPMDTLPALPGKLTAIFNCPWTLAEKRNAGMIYAGTENIYPVQTVFENISSILASTGVPWETARERITRELLFWFEKSPTDFSATEAQTLPRDKISALALAQALAAKPDSAPLIVSAALLSPALATKLQGRAIAENFAVWVECEKFAQAYELRAESAAVFYQESPHGEWHVQTGTPTDLTRAPKTLNVAQLVFRSDKNLFAGALLNAGAGEFFATANGIEIHGKLCGNVPEDIPENAEIAVFLPPQILRISEMPQDECSFEIRNGGEIIFDGHFFYRDFYMGETKTTVCIAAQHRQDLETLDGFPAYAWFFPEDALGFLT